MVKIIITTENQTDSAFCGSIVNDGIPTGQCMYFIFRLYLFFIFNLFVYVRLLLLLNSVARDGVTLDSWEYVASEM